MSMKAAILGSGNIGTDLMIKLQRHGEAVAPVVMVGIDPDSDGLARARRLGLETTAGGVAGLLEMPVFQDIDLVFDATSAPAHLENERLLRAARPELRVIDMTPAAIGPYCVPVVNLDEHRDAPNLNMVTCGGQATIPVVAAVAAVTPVRYAEIIASISSRSAGPGTRANIDEFTQTTARGLETVGGAARGKAIIVLNPAEPPLLMRDTIYTLSEPADEGAVRARIEAMVERVQGYVPGYRLKQAVQFDYFDAARPLKVPGLGTVTGMKTSVFLEVEGAAHYLPAYAGNLDIMTSAAMAAGERLAARVAGAAAVS